MQNSNVTVNSTGASSPVAFVMSFCSGEIPGEPVANIAGAPVVTQSLVTRRHPDGTVRLARVYFEAPNGASVVSWTSRAVTAQGSVSPTTLLDITTYNFDSIINVAGVPKSVRSLVAAGNYTVSTSGPVLTEIIVADHSGASDLGPSNALRIGWVVRFWNQVKRVHVREYGGVEVFDKLGDFTYQLNVSRGPSGAPVNVLNQSVVHRYGKRWTRQGWAFNAPASTPSVALPVEYVSAVGTVPSYDFTKPPTVARQANEAGLFSTSDRSVGGSGLWLPAMNTGGGRPDIASDPEWMKHALLTGTQAMRDVAVGQADLAGWWSMHFREPTVSSRVYGYGGAAGTAASKPVNIAGRNKLQFAKANINLMSNTPAVDRPTFIGAVPAYIGGADPEGWLHDGSHQPNPFRIPYLLTADPFYLEQMEFWAAWCSMMNDPAVAYFAGRGPTGTEGFSMQDLRGNAWMLRNRAVFAHLSTQGSAQEAFYSKQVDNHLAIFAGALNLPATPWNGNSLYVWGATYARDYIFADIAGGSSYGLPPAFNGIPSVGSAGDRDGAIQDLGAVTTAQGGFQVGFMAMALDDAGAMGFTTSPHMDFIAKWYNALYASTCRYAISDYSWPEIDAVTGMYFTSMADMFAKSRVLTRPNWYTDTSGVYSGSGPYLSAFATFNYHASAQAEIPRQSGAYAVLQASALAALGSRVTPYWTWIKPLAHDNQSFNYGGFGLVPRVSCTPVLPADFAVPVSAGIASSKTVTFSQGSLPITCTPTGLPPWLTWDNATKMFSWPSTVAAGTSVVITMSCTNCAGQPSAKTYRFTVT
jgi:Putative Ig domain